MCSRLFIRRSGGLEAPGSSMSGAMTSSERCVSSMHLSRTPASVVELNVRTSDPMSMSFLCSVIGSKEPAGMGQRSLCRCCSLRLYVLEHSTLIWQRWSRAEGKAILSKSRAIVKLRRIGRRKSIRRTGSTVQGPTRMERLPYAWVNGARACTGIG